jgi:Zn-dependent peptidase ImmA (M78 family)/transcriptional regulator with XRE-family HTH domain
VEPSGIGRRIAEARVRVGLTQAGLAADVDLDRSSLAKIENGTRKVSALELAQIADALGERIEWFVEDAPAALVSRRNMSEPGAASPKIDRLIERLARNAEFVIEHDHQISLPAIEPFERPRTVAAINEMVAAARDLLGVDASLPLHDLGTAAASIGLLVFSVDLGPDAADGASILLRTGGVAVVNAHLQVGRRRLTIAHELGHYLLADDLAIDWQIDAPDPGHREALIDRFARVLLLPEPALTQAWSEHRENEEDLRTASVRVASEFRVDMSTLARRLGELRLIRPADVARARRFRTTKADIVEFDLLVAHELREGFLPRPYTEAVLRLYRSEAISAARAIDLMLDSWEETDLPDLPDLPENAIWKFVS